MSLLSLYLTFFKIGLFTIGGGLAALPLLQTEALRQGWFSMDTFFHMVAVSESTPGPIGINMATYVGWQNAGYGGSLAATLGMVSPSLIIIMIVARWFLHFNEKPLVQAAFSGLRPAVTGLIATAAWKVISVAVLPLAIYAGTQRAADLFDPIRLGIFAALGLAQIKWNWHPVFFVVIGAVLGMILL
jgi:chromate transporter